ncbi:NAD-dependent protein deacetylase hst2-1 [Friedmanniomyces endolithicus]|uniref:NAD-dependent protein deacetylase n=1 Tax=Friedmanniomyces endolithicus TaxID=329885 RepID=A0A4U0VC91_9PEZI|nr:NAD-dependent protein deacetylase hst2-1 [Friedmanniomyces endolithicus]
MGNEESTPIDESVPPQTLSSRTLEGLAEYIKSGKASKIVVMTGAGISTSAGIPDFRSPETGLYANLARLNLPYAEAVFDISFFKQNPEPFYTLAHELYPGKYRPTITHSFIRLLHDKGLLLKLFTQNIDCLEREAGVPDDKIVEAHGSFARQSCIECKHPYPEDDIKRHIAAMEIPRCHECEGLVKPEIVFFGEQLPQAFFENRMLPAQSDLCIVMGTSLTVQPFASLPGAARGHTPRLLINKERVGGLGNGTDDVLLLGDCDNGVKKLAKACGWLEELEKLWAETAGIGKDQAEGVPDEPAKSKDEVLEDEIDRLTKEVDESLNLSKWHEEKVRGELMPRSANGADAAATSEGLHSRSQPHEDEKGNLGHVFVSEDSKEVPLKSADPAPTEKKDEA